VCRIVSSVMPQQWEAVGRASRTKLTGNWRERALLGKARKLLFSSERLWEEEERARAVEGAGRREKERVERQVRAMRRDAHRGTATGLSTLLGN